MYAAPGPEHEATATGSFAGVSLWDAFFAEDGGQRVACTGQVIPHGTLKSRALRESLSWAASLPYKFVTVKAACCALLHLERKRGIQFPIIPGVSVARWRELEARRIARVCHRIQKNTSAQASRERKLAAMDNEETQAWSLEAGLRRSLLFDVCNKLMHRRI